MIVMYIFAVLQYRSTYTTVYDESANRRISLAEKLRKLPLAFFGEKNLSDLTATIMAVDDCFVLGSAACCRNPSFLEEGNTEKQ